jgi:hypothetical protein
MQLTKTLKIVGTIALVGALATIGLYACDKDAVSSFESPLFLADTTDAEDMREFQSFISRNNRNYLTKDEYNLRMANFKQNMALIREHEDGHEGYTLGVTQFADMSEAEWEA